MLRLLTFTLLLVFAASSSQGQMRVPSPAFEHVPLHYHGPDPTSNYFLPANTSFEREPSTFAQLPPSTELAPELLNYPTTTYDAMTAGPDISGQENMPFAPGAYGDATLYYKPPISENKDPHNRL